MASEPVALRSRLSFNAQQAHLLLASLGQAVAARAGRIAEEELLEVGKEAAVIGVLERAVFFDPARVPAESGEERKGRRGMEGWWRMSQGGC
eukprot:3260361-Rhodomonas_salina.1